MASYCVSGDSSILIEQECGGLTRQIYFTGQHSDSSRFAVQVSTYVQGETSEIAHSYLFDKDGMMIRANHRYGSKFIFDETPKVLQSVPRDVALREFEWLKDIVAKLVRDCREKIKPEYQKTIDAVCQNDFALN